jgi:hypothetical protein
MQEFQETDIHVPCGIRTRNPSKRAIPDPRLRTRYRWDRQGNYFLKIFAKELNLIFET